VLVNGSASATFNITNDVLTEGTETMTLSLNGVTCPTSKSIIINDTSLSQTPTPTPTVTNTPTPTVTNTPTPTTTPKPTPTPTVTNTPTPTPTVTNTPTPTVTPAPANFNETLSINSPLALSDDGTLMSLTPRSTYIAETTSSNYIRRNIMTDTLTLVDGPINTMFKNKQLTNYNDGYGYYFYGTVSGGGSTTYSIVLDFIEQTNLTSYVSYIQITNEDTGVVLKKYVCFPQDDQYNWHNVLQLNTWVEAVLDGSGNETYDEETGTILITQPITTPFVFTVPTVTDTSILPNLYEHKVKTIVPTYPAPGSLLTLIQNFENRSDNKFSFIGKYVSISGYTQLLAARKYSNFIYRSLDNGNTWSIRRVINSSDTLPIAASYGKIAAIINSYIFNEGGILVVDNNSWIDFTSNVRINNGTNGTNSFNWQYITKNIHNDDYYLGFYYNTGSTTLRWARIDVSNGVYLEIPSNNDVSTIFFDGLTHIDASGETWWGERNEIGNILTDNSTDFQYLDSGCVENKAEGYIKKGSNSTLLTTKCSEQQNMKVHTGNNFYLYESCKNFEILQNVGSGIGSILYDTNNKTFILLPRNDNKIMYVKDSETTNYTDYDNFRARVESQLPASKNWVDHAL
jgi:hypothetical protein